MEPPSYALEITHLELEASCSENDLESDLLSQPFEHLGVRLQLQNEPSLEILYQSENVLIPSLLAISSK